MEELKVRKIGTVEMEDGGMCIQLQREYLPALAGLEGFRHLNILWWFSGCDTLRDRKNLREQSPYRTGPDELGVFATRSPLRPNPLALSCVEVTHIDAQAGKIGITWMDADVGSPVLDIKPYIPSLDRVESCDLPQWCSHWPSSIEDSGEFDWEAELN